MNNKNEITTTNFSEFGERERLKAENLLSAWRTQGLPSDFYDDEVVIMLNKNSGNVFLTNSEYQVAMLNGNVLESFYSCPECGRKGFIDEIPLNEHTGDSNGKLSCADWLRNIKQNRRIKK